MGKFDKILGAIDEQNNRIYNSKDYQTLNDSDQEMVRSFAERKKQETYRKLRQQDDELKLDDPAYAFTKRRPITNDNLAMDFAEGTLNSGMRAGSQMVGSTISGLSVVPKMLG